MTVFLIPESTPVGQSPPPLGCVEFLFEISAQDDAYDLHVTPYEERAFGPDIPGTAKMFTTFTTFTRQSGLPGLVIQAFTGPRLGPMPIHAAQLRAIIACQ